MSFKDILGHDKAIEFLLRSIENKMTSHAYIFTGPEGIGKKLVALNFAKSLNCLEAPKARPCDGCISCRKIDSSNHPDVFIVEPAKEGSRLGIDKVRELIKNVSLKPYEGRTKVYIIEGAGTLTSEASNAFLKTLEEPPSDSVIIFITDNAEGLLPTISSRCQTLKFFSLGADDVCGILEKKHGIDGIRSKILSRISSGSCGVALKINEKKFFEKRELVLGGLADGSFFDLDFEKLPKNEIRMYLDMILSWYRDVLVIKSSDKASGSVINIDKIDEVRKEALRRDFGYLENVIKQAIMTCSFLDSNANAKLALGVLGANLSEG